MILGAGEVHHVRRDTECIGASDDYVEKMRVKREAAGEDFKVMEMRSDGLRELVDV